LSRNNRISPSGFEGNAVTTMGGYIALVHKDEGTSYGVSFPDVPGCVSAGDTFEEALANAAEALAGHFALIDTGRRRGDPCATQPRTTLLLRVLASSCRYGLQVAPQWKYPR
jgi:predicted RNase H-like HicB family nuclease